MNDTTGGPAFPVKGDPSEYYTGGLTIRDWFAGQAMIAGLTGTHLGRTIAERSDPLAKIARVSYEAADAMLAARKAP